MRVIIDKRLLLAYVVALILLAVGGCAASGRSQGVVTEAGRDQTFEANAIKRLDSIFEFTAGTKTKIDNSRRNYERGMMYLGAVMPPGFVLLYVWLNKTNSGRWVCGKPRRTKTLADDGK